MKKKVQFNLECLYVQVQNIHHFFFYYSMIDFIIT